MHESAQQSLFEEAPRTELDATSWVELHRSWLSSGDADALFAHLASTAPWQQRTRWMFQERVLEPRLTAEYLDLRAAGSPLLDRVADGLSARYGVPYDGAWLNLYRDGDDSTSWHGDRPTCKRPECVVPVLSLGATRRFALRPAGGGTSTSLTVASGDLVVMGGRCQRDWRHAVPKMPRVAAPRISVNFTSTTQRTPEHA